MRLFALITSSPEQTPCDQQELSPKPELWRQKGWILVLKHMTLSRTNQSWHLSQQEARVDFELFSFPFDFLFHVYFCVYFLHRAFYTSLHRPTISVSRRDGKTNDRKETFPCRTAILIQYLYVSRLIINMLFPFLCYDYDPFLIKRKVTQWCTISSSLAILLFTAGGLPTHFLPSNLTSILHRKEKKNLKKTPININV